MSVSVGDRPPPQGSVVPPLASRDLDAGAAAVVVAGPAGASSTTQTLTHLKGEHPRPSKNRAQPARPTTGGRRPHVDADRTARLPAARWPLSRRRAATRSSSRPVHIALPARSHPAAADNRAGSQVPSIAGTRFGCSARLPHSWDSQEPEALPGSFGSQRRFERVEAGVLYLTAGYDANAAVCGPAARTAACTM